jgi:phosphatidate cytidylyltransferase
MSYLDASEHDDRTPENRRRRRAARPAWDAATYGVPDDLRRSRSARDRDGGASTYPPDTHPPDTYAPEAYSRPPEAYPREPYGADPYPSPVEPYPAAPPAPEPPNGPGLGLSGGPLSGYPQAPSYRPEPYRYEPEAPPYQPTYDPGPAAYDPGPAAYDPGPPTYDPGPAYDPGPLSRRYDPGPSTYGYDPGPAADELGPPVYDPGPPAYDPGPPAYDPGPEYPGGVDTRDDEPAGPPSRAGRNLPAAIGVGALLAAVALGSLFLWRPAFFAVIAVAVGVGIWELVRAIRTTGVNPPMVPLLVGGALMTGLAWWGQADALTFGLIVTVLAAMVWRLSDGPEGYGSDITAAALVAVYVPFLAGFAALLAQPADGDKRVLVTLALIVLSDTGGYVAGVLFGRHPMAPRVSPKKSWEGLGGSFVATGIGGAILLATVFHGSALWGILFGFAIATASTLGDLGESMIKRDLGVKDMSSLLPGHGGVMDRLDSIVVAAPTAYVILLLLVPPL